MISVDIFTVWFNRAAAVEDSIMSLIRQDHGKIRIFAIDDGSTDDTLEKLNKMQRCAVEQGVFMRVVANENQGLTASLVEAIDSFGESEFFAIHGAGDISLKNRISKQLETALATGAVVVGSWIDQFSVQGLAHRRRTPPINPVNDLRRFAIARPGTHGAALIRRDSYIISGGYRKEFRYAQDADLWIRIEKVGPIFNCQEVLYERRIFSDSVTYSQSSRLRQRMYSTVAIKLGLLEGKKQVHLWEKLKNRPIETAYPVNTHILRLFLEGGWKNPPRFFGEVCSGLALRYFTIYKSLRKGAMKNRFRD